MTLPDVITAEAVRDALRAAGYPHPVRVQRRGQGVARVTAKLTNPQPGDALQAGDALRDALRPLGWVQQLCSGGDWPVDVTPRLESEP